MSIISHAQNFEDVMLWRALKHIEHGFYIDVGAWSPDLDSVTKLFYERGWQGLNVEPNQNFYLQLQERRPRDRNLCIALGEREGVLSMNFMDCPGLSTLSDEIAAQHLQAGLVSVRREVHVSSLFTVWGQHVPAGQDVHFLKLDVEGFEEGVIRGNDWVRYRPWIVVAEATLPMSQIESYGSWEPILFSSGYHLAYADGLNRFYVAAEHKELLVHFKYPPNVFDGFQTRSEIEAQELARLYEARAVQAEARAVQAESDNLQSMAELQAIYASISWRVTKPLRAIKGKLCSEQVATTKS